MTTRYGFLRGAIAALAVSLLAACGGGGGSVGGIDRLGISASSGPITGFGSVIVNGVEWDTSGATIRVDDAAGIESDLRVGQVVVITGDLDPSGLTGQADRIEYDSSLEGPIGAISVANGTFTVLSQTVIVGATTAFDDSIPDRVVDGRRGLEDLLAGDVVEVSGFRDSNGAVRATRVEIRGGADDFEVRGVVSNLTATTFSIGSLQVNYATASLQDFGASSIATGNLVEVEGDFSGGVLVATKVELEDNLPGEDGDSGEIEGLVTSFTSPTNFEVNGVRVTTTAGTDYEGGTVADLAANVRLEVEGEFNSGGVLVADEVKFRVQAEDEDVEIAGNVESVNLFADYATITIDGVEEAILVILDATTQYEDKSDAEVRDFSAADLAVGNYVRLHGAVDSSVPPNVAREIITTRLEREDADPDNEFVLQGPVEFISEPVLIVLGVTVNADAALEFRDLNDGDITQTEFFEGVIEGDVVKVTAALDAVFGGEVDPDEIEIEELN